MRVQFFTIDWHSDIAHSGKRATLKLYTLLCCHVLCYDILLIITRSSLTSKSNIWAMRDAVVAHSESTSMMRGPLTCIKINKDSASARWYIMNLLQCFGDMKCNTIKEDTWPCKRKTNGYSKSHQ